MIYVCVDIGPTLDEISSVHFSVHRGEVQTKRAVICFSLHLTGQC